MKTYLLVVVFSGNKFTVEELFAMLLENAKETAQAFAGKCTQLLFMY